MKICANDWADSHCPLGVIVIEFCFSIFSTDKFPEFNEFLLIPFLPHCNEAASTGRDSTQSLAKDIGTNLGEQLVVSQSFVIGKCCHTS